MRIAIRWIPSFSWIFYTWRQSSWRHYYTILWLHIHCASDKISGHYTVFMAARLYSDLYLVYHWNFRQFFFHSCKMYILSNISIYRNNIRQSVKLTYKKRLSWRRRNFNKFFTRIKRFYVRSNAFTSYYVNTKKGRRQLIWRSVVWVTHAELDSSSATHFFCPLCWHLPTKHSESISVV